MLALEPRPLEGALHHCGELGTVDGLGEEVCAACLHGLHGQLDVLLPGDRHRFELRVARPGLAHERDPVHARHHQVGEHQVEAVARKHPVGLFPGCGHPHLVAARGEDLLEEVPEEALVVDDEDPPGH